MMVGMYCVGLMEVIELKVEDNNGGWIDDDVWQSVAMDEKKERKR